MAGAAVEQGQKQPVGPSLEERRQVFQRLHQALAGVPPEPKSPAAASPSDPSRELAYLYFVANSDATVARPGPEGFRRTPEDLHSAASAEYALWELLVREQIRDEFGGAVRLRHMAFGEGSLTVFLVIGVAALKTVKDYPDIRRGIQALIEDLRKLFGRLLNSKAVGPIRVVGHWDPGPALAEPSPRATPPRLAAESPKAKPSKAPKAKRATVSLSRRSK